VERLSAPSIEGKNPAAVTLGRLGGLKGGKARAESLSAKKRAEIATKAALASFCRETRKVLDALGFVAFFLDMYVCLVAYIQHAEQS
jgi:hypothetical protein